MEKYEQGKGEHQKLYDYFRNEHEKWFDHNELEAISRIVNKDDVWSQHVGLSFDRVAHNEREKAFYEQWKKENEPRSHINYGHGILQDLFFLQVKDSPNHFMNVFNNLYCHTEINKRDRMIVATVIQWLGSNCGMAFLHEAVGKFGYVLHPKRDDK